MRIKRIVTNLAAADVSKAKQFYGEILGLKVVMDQGWIVTFAAPAKWPLKSASPVKARRAQRCRIFLSKLMTWRKHCAVFVPLGLSWSTVQRESRGKCADFTQNSLAYFGRLSNNLGTAAQNERLVAAISFGTRSGASSTFLSTSSGRRLWRCPADPSAEHVDPGDWFV
jgi:hypothetical protein